MVPGRVPFKIVSDSPALHSRWLLLLKIEIVIKICLTCIIGINRLKVKFHKTFHKKNLSSFWLILKQQWTIEEISIFSNNSHLEWSAGLSDTILKGTHPGTIPTRFGLIWFRGLQLLNQIKPNLAGRVPFTIMSDSSALHSRWLLLLKIVISSIVHCCSIINQKSSNFSCSYMTMSRLTFNLLNYSLPCSCS
jgi:hypothetical protein